MKLFNFRLIICLCFLSGNSFSINPPIEAGPGANVKVFVHNVCEYWSRIYISEGVDSLGSHASIGYATCTQPVSYVHVDSILPLTKIKYSDLSQNSSWIAYRKLICVGNETDLFTYRISYPNFYWCDSTLIEPAYFLLSDSLVDAKVWGENIIVIRNTNLTSNFIIYDSSFTVTVFSTQLNIIPEKLFTDGYYCSVMGRDSNSTLVLKTFDLQNMMIVRDTVLSQLDSDPVNFYAAHNYTMVITEPGDTLVHLYKYNWYDSTLTDTVIYPGSGMGAHFWDSSTLQFQPEHDTSSLGNDKKVFVFEHYRMQFRGAFNVNRHFRLLSNPGGVDGYFPYAYGVPDTGVGDQYYIYDTYNYILQDSGVTAPNVVFFNADFRCPISVSEYDDSHVEWKVFPNPSKEYINLSASGLICGRDYKVDIVDSYGILKHEEIIHAKMTLSLPTEKLSPGIYFIRIHTLRGLVVQRFVKL